jgi:hypothetical protein
MKTTSATKLPQIVLALCILWLLGSSLIPMLMSDAPKETASDPVTEAEAQPRAVQKFSWGGAASPVGTGRVIQDASAIRQLKNLPALSYEIEPLTQRDGKYKRWVKITNHSDIAAYNRTISITCNKPAAGHAPVSQEKDAKAPSPKFSSSGTRYVTQVAIIPPRQSVVIEFSHDEPFQIEWVSVTHSR